MKRNLTPQQAAELRNLTARLRHETLVTMTAAVTFGGKGSLTAPEIHDIVETAWEAANLDDLFHEIGSFGYRFLIKEGWTPFAAEAEWEGGEPIANWASDEASSRAAVQGSSESVPTGNEGAEPADI